MSQPGPAATVGISALPDLPGTRVALERTFAAAQAKRVRRTRRQQPGDP